MHADAFFHAVHHGQDYARAGADFAIISDGCSSSPDTDCGARWLTLAASVEHDIERIVDRALAVGLVRPEALDATLLTLRRVGEQIEATVHGDGIVFGVRRSGEIEAWEIDQGGTPAYPVYRRQPQRWAGWAGESRVRHWPSGRTSSAVSSDFPVFSMAFDPTDWRLVGIASDGLLALRGAEGPVPLLDVLTHVTDIRAPRGRFIERSSTFFLRRTCPKLGWTPTDDYSVAAFWLGD